MSDHCLRARPWLYTLLHSGRPVLLDLSGGVLRSAAAWSDRVALVEAVPESSRWAMPVTGEVAAPGAPLIRPDGHIAWTGDATNTAELHAALTTWCGPLRPPGHHRP